SIGHIPFTHFCFLPWFAYFILKTDESWKYILAAAICIMLIIIGNGAAVPLLYTCFFTGLFILLYSLERKTLKYIKTYIGAIVAGILLSSVKFIPMYHYLSQNQWEGMVQDSTPLAIIPKAFFSLNHEIFRLAIPDQYWGWHEYSAYISPIIVILALVGLLLSFRKCRIWLVLSLFFFIFGLGYFSEFSLWGLMSKLPGFSSIRSPGRAFQFVVLAVAVMSAYGLDDVISRFKSSVSLKKIISIALLVFIIAGNFLISLPALKTIAYKQPTETKFNEDFRQVVEDKFKIYNLFLENRGSLVAPWLSAYKDSRGIVAENGQVYMEYILQGQAAIISRHYTPNRVDYEIAPSSAGTILFSIGFDEGWYALDGRRLYESNGLVATDFRSSDKHISLACRTPYFYTGLIISLLAIFGFLLVYFNRNLGISCKAIFE
ncbi:MAG: 6-pyruvoyl-tetrahydropterin synthase-related protein, partial [Candidatus Zixiibacteriota bacterium]